VGGGHGLTVRNADSDAMGGWGFVDAVGGTSDEVTGATGV
jgi:hypothetical protein